jgi:hypothetical protein
VCGLYVIETAVTCILILHVLVFIVGGYAVAQLVEALRHKPEGHGFDFRWSHWNFSVT